MISGKIYLVETADEANTMSNLSSETYTEEELKKRRDTEIEVSHELSKSGSRELSVEVSKSEPSSEEEGNNKLIFEVSNQMSVDNENVCLSFNCLFG